MAPVAVDGPPTGSTGSSPGGAKITREHFYSWKDTCRVRQIQKKYEEVVEAAKSNKRGVAGEMMAQGYKDFSAFNKGCPKFSLSCWPLELAELGSGFVLYFHFLALLAIIFAIMVVAQLPVLATYANANYLAGWQSSAWGQLWSSEDPCACLGTNNGILGLEGASDQYFYGTECGAWDEDAAFQVNLASPGRWACRKWCFADPNCPARLDEESPSRTNVHFHSLVRSYSFCATAEDEATLPDCAFEEDVPFAEAGSRTVGAQSAIGSHWMTPGNFGPYQAENDWIPSLYLALSIAIVVLLLIGFQRMVVTDITVDAASTSPNDFAVMVRGLPKTATEEGQLVQWFSQNAVQGKQVEVVKVVIGWDVEEFRDNIKELKDLRKELQGLDPADPRGAEIKTRMTDIAQALNSAAPDRASRLQSSGICVVTFRHQEDMRTCLHRWNTFWARFFYSDSSDLGCCWQNNRMMKGDMLPLYPVGGEPTCRIKIVRAANPGDINWMELGVEPMVKYKRLAKTTSAMALVILTTFFSVYGLNKLADFLDGEKDKQEEGTNSSYGFQALALMPALLVVGMNILLQLTARFLGKLEYHETKTEEEFAQAWKMSIGMILNTAGVLLFLYTRPREWYMRGGLIEKTAMMLITNSLIPPFIPVLDFQYKMKYRKRRSLTDAKIEHFNEVIHRVGPQPKTPAEKKELDQVKASIETYKREAFAASEMDAPRRFADALKTTFCCIFFSPVMPMVSVVGFFGIVLQYACDKYALLRVYKRPDKPANCSMAMFSVSFVKRVAPLALAVGTYVFLTPSWADKELMLSNFIMSFIVGVGAIFTPMSLLGRCFRRCMEDSAIGEIDYYQAQYMWAKEMKYHKDHFIYAKLPDTLNPEYLKPGMSAAVNLADVKATYGTATAQAADATALGTSSVAGGAALRGGIVMAVPVGSGGAGAAAPSPTTYGLQSTGYVPGMSAATPGFAGFAPAGSLPASGGGSAPPGSLPAGGAFAPPGSLPPPGSASAPAVAAAAPVVVSAGTDTAIWEYQAKDHWYKYGPDCHGFIERSFKQFQAGDAPAQIRVNTNGFHLSIDFNRMTQLKADTHKVSPIRRRPA